MKTNWRLSLSITLMSQCIRLSIWFGTMSYSIHHNVTQSLHNQCFYNFICNNHPPSFSNAIRKCAMLWLTCSLQISPHNQTKIIVTYMNILTQRIQWPKYHAIEKQTQKEHEIVCLWTPKVCKIRFDPKIRPNSIIKAIGQKTE